MYIVDSNSGKKTLAGELYVLLADVFTMSFRAQSAHWNVKGPDFHQYHGFFAVIYKDVDGSIDDIAENIRKLGFDAPLNLVDMCSTTMIAEQQCACDPMSLVTSLNAANEVIISRLNSVFTISNELNEQAIANYAAGRLDMHLKWAWQMRTTLGMDNGMPGKLVADSLLEASFDDVESQHVGMFNDMLESGATRTIVFSDKTEQTLSQKVDSHNKKTVANRTASVDKVKAVYRRGVLEHLSTSSRPALSLDSAGMRRVDAYLSLLKSGTAQGESRVSDADLLPRDHPRASAITASASAVQNELTVTLRSVDDYASTDEAIAALAEFSGQGYDIVPCLRAAWKRGVDANQSGYTRAGELAIRLYDSKDADLLPKRA